MLKFMFNNRHILLNIEIKKSISINKYKNYLNNVY